MNYNVSACYVAETYMKNRLKALHKPTIGILSGLLDTLSPRDAQRAARSNEVALGRLSCCCAFCKEGGVPLGRHQASAVTKRVPEAAVYYTASLLSARCASRGKIEHSRYLPAGYNREKD